MECWYCGEIGLVKAEANMKKRNKGKKDADDRGDKALVALLQQDNQKLIWRSLGAILHT